MADLIQDTHNPARITGLDFLRLVRIAGSDRSAFLQSQLTQDIRRITPAQGVRYAWADAQGRVLVAGEAFAWSDALWLTVPAALADSIVRRLRLFILRAKVTIDLADSGLTGWMFPAGPTPSLDTIALPVQPLDCSATADWCALRIDSRRMLFTAPASTLPALLARLPGTAADANSWSLADIRDGFTRAADSPGVFIPQMLNLDLSGAVSFDKGCYPGQEIVTRTRHLGRLKRRLLRYGIGLPLPAPGDPVFGPGGETGTIVSAAAADTGGEILAVVRFDAAGESLFADAGHVRPLVPLDLPYEIPAVPSPAR